MPSTLKSIAFAVVVVVAASAIYRFVETTQSPHNVEDFSKFIQRVDEGEVSAVTFVGASEVTYVTKAPETFRAILPPPNAQYEGLTNRLIERGITVKVSHP